MNTIMHVGEGAELGEVIEDLIKMSKNKPIKIRRAKWKDMIPHNLDGDQEPGDEEWFIVVEKGI